MTWQHDPRVKAVFDEIVAHTPDIGDTPVEGTTYLTPKRRRRTRARIAIGTAAAAVIALAGLITARAGGGDHGNAAIGTPPANGSDIVTMTTSGEDTTEPSAATTAEATTVTSSTESAAPTTTPAPTTSMAPPAAFEPLRPEHVAATWLPSGYSQSDDPPYLRLSAPTEPADDIWVKVERDTSSRVDRPASAVDVAVRGGTAWVDVVSAKATAMLLFRDADSVYLIIYAPDDIPIDILARIADGLTN